MRRRLQLASIGMGNVMEKAKQEQKSTSKEIRLHTTAT